MDDLLAAISDDPPRNELTKEQEDAAEKFAGMAERAQGARDALKRAIAADALRAAKAVLRPDENAIMDLVVFKGRSLTELAVKAGRRKEDLEVLLIGACEKLAVHYNLKPAVRAEGPDDDAEG